MNTTAMNTDLHISHISRQFNEELGEIRKKLFVMGGLVEQQVAAALKALIEADSALAEQVFVNEAKVDELDCYIDEECARIIALRQPAASDLRLIMAVLKATSDLERIGDEANKIARIAVALCEQGESPRGYVETRHIGQHVSTMMHDALDAFARFDAEQALQVAREDDAVDLEYEAAIRQLVTFMMEDPRSISRVLNVIWSLRALERIGDHSRNIAEHVLYLVKGKDARHISVEQMEKLVRDER